MLVLLGVRRCHGNFSEKAMAKIWQSDQQIYIYILYIYTGYEVLSELSCLPYFFSSQCQWTCTSGSWSSIHSSWWRDVPDEFFSAATLVSKFDLPGLVNVNKKNYGKIHHFIAGQIHHVYLFIWHFSIPFLVYQRLTWFRQFNIFSWGKSFKDERKTKTLPGRVPSGELT